MELEQPNGVSYTNAFMVFPAEIWDVVLERLDDSEDMENILTAMPELRILCAGKQFKWLIGEILPLIMPKFLTFYDIKFCRLVSRRWNSAVGRTLEVHPDRLSFDCPSLTQMREIHFNYTSWPCLCTNFCRFYRLVEESDESSWEATENPFPGRLVYYSVNGYDDDESGASKSSDTDYYEDYMKVTLGDALPTFKIHGHHIRFITIEFTKDIRFYSDSVMSGVINSLFQCLLQMTNLKSLKIAKGVLGLDGFDGKRTKETLKVMAASTVFPFRLETLDLSGFGYDSNLKSVHKLFVTSLVNHDQLKKLEINSDYWKHKYGETFPNLTQLSVATGDRKKLKMILEDLRGSRIRKLSVLTNKIPLCDILEVIAPFQIFSLEVIGNVNDRFAEASQVEPNFHRAKRAVSSFLVDKFSSVARFKSENKKFISVPSIQHLTLVDTHQEDFEFLQSFPFLRYLTVDPKLWACGLWCGDDIFNDYLIAYHRDKMSCDREHFIQVWENLPNLEVMTIYGEPRNIYQFVREDKFNPIVYIE